MAKKRRRPHHGSPARPPGRGAVRTAEPPAEDDAPSRDATDAIPGRAPGADPTGPRTRPVPQRTRAEKKELARKQREEIRRRIRRAQRTRQLTWIAGAAVVAAVAVFLIARPEGPPPSPESLPGILETEAPWPANSEQALERADLINLPSHSTTLAMHEHAQLQVFVHGEQEPVPQGIGILGNEAASLHTHTADGVVHVESSTVANFTLGQFFDVWGVRLTGTCIGGSCVQGDDELHVYVDGERVQGSIRQVPLDDQSVIVVTFGTRDELPDPIPSTFDFGSVQP